MVVGDDGCIRLSALGPSWASWSSWRSLVVKMSQ